MRVAKPDRDLSSTNTPLSSCFYPECRHCGRARARPWRHQHTPDNLIFFRKSAPSARFDLFPGVKTAFRSGFGGRSFFFRSHWYPGQVFWARVFLNSPHVKTPDWRIGLAITPWPLFSFVLFTFNFSHFRNSKSVGKNIGKSQKSQK